MGFDHKFNTTPILSILEKKLVLYKETACLDCPHENKSLGN